MLQESAFIFPLQSAELIGIIHEGIPAASRGVLIVVGGPQYRVGSHRQFLLLARTLASTGVPVMRFDYRGMGDSGGESVTFEQIDEDIAAALDAFFERSAGLREVVIWGLCDAASAALFYAWKDSRVAGLVLLNPWVRTEAGEARAYLKHYYLARLFSADLWRKIGRGELNLSVTIRSLLGNIARMFSMQKPKGGNSVDTIDVGSGNSRRSLPDRMAEGFKRFSGPILVILSGDDLTAAEFKDVIGSSKVWRRLINQPRVTRRDLPEANHTFARREWRDQVAYWTLQWLRSW